MPDISVASGIHGFTVPLLFLYDKRGFQVGVPYTSVDPTYPEIRSKITMHDYFRYYFHYKKNQPNPYLKCG